MSQDKTQAKLKIIPLGGLHEIGKNTRASPVHRQDDIVVAAFLRVAVHCCNCPSNCSHICSCLKLLFSKRV